MIYDVGIAFFFPELISCPFSRVLSPFFLSPTVRRSPFVSVHCPTYILVDLDLPTTCAYIPYITIYHSCIYS